MPQVFKKQFFLYIIKKVPHASLSTLLCGTPSILMPWDKQTKSHRESQRDQAKQEVQEVSCITYILKWSNFIFTLHFGAISCPLQDISIHGTDGRGWMEKFSRIREALHIWKVMKLWTFSVAPLAPFPPPIYGHLWGCFIVKLVVFSSNLSFYR